VRLAFQRSSAHILLVNSATIGRQPFLVASVLSILGDLWLLQSAVLVILVVILLVAWCLIESRQRRTVERTLAERFNR
jgi:protein-S-isoprenylcysteine O-methyltransferase Ste14